MQSGWQKLIRVFAEVREKLREILILEDHVVGERETVTEEGPKETGADGKSSPHLDLSTVILESV